MNIGKKTSWQVVAVAAAALLSGVAHADGRDHRGRGDDRGWRHHDRHYDNRHDRGWHHGHRHHGYRHYHHPRRWAPPPPHWRYGPPRHRHYYDSYYRSSYWIPERGGVHVTIGFPLY